MALEPQTLIIVALLCAFIGTMIYYNFDTITSWISTNQLNNISSTTNTGSKHFTSVPKWDHFTNPPHASPPVIISLYTQYFTMSRLAVVKPRMLTKSTYSSRKLCRWKESFLPMALVHFSLRLAVL